MRNLNDSGTDAIALFEGIEQHHGRLDADMSVSVLCEASVASAAVSESHQGRTDKHEPCRPQSSACDRVSLALCR